MIRGLRIALVLGLCSVGLVSAPPPAAAQAREYVIGAVLELSGPFAIWGLPQRNAIQMLVDDINAQGGIRGTRIRLVVYDNQSKETDALLVAKKLVEQDEVLAVIGGGTTPTTMPLIPYITEQKVPLCSMGSSNRIIEPPADRKWAFKTPNNTRDVVVKMFEHFRVRGSRSSTAAWPSSGSYRWSRPRSGG